MMPSLAKNSFCFFILLLSRCNNVNISNPDKTLVIKSDTIPASSISHTILLSGFPPPVFYENAQDIISKKYNIEFIWAAGCIVNERLSDSIEMHNDAAFHEMNKHYKADMREKIPGETDREYTLLVKIDSLLKSSEKLNDKSWTKKMLPYFTKQTDAYHAYFITKTEDKKSGALLQKLKLLVKIDTTGSVIQSIQEKDSIINTNFKELQK